MNKKYIKSEECTTWRRIADQECSAGPFQGIFSNFEDLIIQNLQ